MDFYDIFPLSTQMTENYDELLWPQNALLQLIPIQKPRLTFFFPGLNHPCRTNTNNFSGPFLYCKKLGSKESKNSKFSFWLILTEFDWIWLPLLWLILTHVDSFWLILTHFDSSLTQFDCSLTPVWLIMTHFVILTHFASFWYFD